MILSATHTVPYHIPLTTPFATAAGEIALRNGWIVQIEDDAGRVGQGEWAPLPGWSADVTQDGARAVRDALELLQAAAQSTETDALIRQIPGMFPGRPAMIFALETALLDLAAQASRQPLFRQLNAHAPAKVSLNAVLPLGELKQTVETAARRVGEGYRTLKLKIRGPQDEALLVALRARLGDDVVLRLDANGAWDLPTAVAVMRQFEPYGIAYVEQPLPPGDYQALAELRREAGIAVAVDESVSDMTSVKQLLEQEAMDVIILKPMIQGGLLACMEMARLAAEAGVAVVITTTLDTVVGRVAAAHLAAACGTPELAHGLATGGFLARDLAPDPLVVSGGVAELPVAPGLGIARIEG